MTIDDVLAQVRARLDLEADREHELLEEIRGHLQDAVDAAMAGGLDHEAALAEAASRFGIVATAGELRRAHAGWGALDGVLAAAVPVVLALLFRWLIFAPDGTATGWREALNRPAFWVIAIISLLAPLARFRQRRAVLAVWALFWGLSLATALGAAVRW
jgi:hypothetical protein